MKVINRLDEIQKISKYSKYINNTLLPAINESLGLDLEPIEFNTDPYTSIYQTYVDRDGYYADITLQFTTNRRDLDGICWATFIIFGSKFHAGIVTGNVDDDLAIIENSYYDFFSDVESGKILIPRF